MATVLSRTAADHDAGVGERSETRGWRRIVSLVLSVGLLVAACAGGEEAAERSGAAVDERAKPENLAPNQTLNVYSFAKPTNFDPAKLSAGTFGADGLGRQYAEPLLKPEPGVLDPKKLDVTGAAAEEYDTSADGLTYTFRLRRDAKYHDGRTVTAGDFVYAWRRLIDPRVAAPLGRIFAGVVEGGQEAANLGPNASADVVEAALGKLGLRAVDDRTFEVKLAHRAPYFKWIATLMPGAPVRRDVVERFGTDTWATKPETLITNGPFKVSEIGPASVTMDANPHYWDKPKLSRLVAFYGLEPAPRWAKYLNGEIDVSNGPGSRARDAALADPRFKDEILRYLELSTQWLQFNTAKPPFDNARVRLAFAQAIDRNAYQGAASEPLRPRTTLVPQGIPGYNPGVGSLQEFDPAKAKATLDASGVDRQQLNGIKILTAPPQEPDALFLQDQLQKHLGITTTIESADAATLNARVRQGDYQMRTTFIGHAARYPDPHDFFSVFLSNSRDNLMRWKNDEYDRLVRQAGATSDQDQRLRLYDQAHRILVEEAPVAFLAQLERVFWVKPWVRGIERTPVDTAFLPGDLYSKEIVIGAH